MTRNLNNLESSLSSSYRTCPVWTTRFQRLVFQRPTIVFKCTECREFRLKSEVPTVGSSDMYREFRHLKYSNSVAMVFKYAEGREFRCESGVPTVESSDNHREFRCLGLN